VDDLEALLRQHDHRVTNPRRLVWGVLQNADEHLTVEQVASRVHSADAGVNLASIYRALALLRDLGAVRESQLAGGASHWEIAHPDEHFHVICDDCGKVDHHVGSLVQLIIDHLESGHHFEPRSVDLVVRGRCHDCAQPNSVAKDSQ
jgi:Fe2+ or Zn2+ uptake regulation protein